MKKMIEEEKNILEIKAKNLGGLIRRLMLKKDLFEESECYYHLKLKTREVEKMNEEEKEGMEKEIEEQEIQEKEIPSYKDFKLLLREKVKKEKGVYLINQSYLNQFKKPEIREWVTKELKGLLS